MQFKEFPKIARLSREIVITEKIDGTNGQVNIVQIGGDEQGEGACVVQDGLAMYVGSRKRWITPKDDNYGFAKWCVENAIGLFGLGTGAHFGEWWGCGIQRNYGLKEKRFSLFNVAKWSDDAVRPACCSVVPVLWRGIFDTAMIDHTLQSLAEVGSLAAPGFMKPEGIVVFHCASAVAFKKTIEKDAEHKGQPRG